MSRTTMGKSTSILITVRGSAMTTAKSGLRVSRGGRRTAEQPDVGNSLPSANHSFFFLCLFSTHSPPFTFLFFRLFPRLLLRRWRTEVALAIRIFCMGTYYSVDNFPLFFQRVSCSTVVPPFPKVPTKVYSSQYMIA